MKENVTHFTIVPGLGFSASLINDQLGNQQKINNFMGYNIVPERQSCKNSRL